MKEPDLPQPHSIHPDDEEELVAWLLGDLPPAAARQCEEKWRSKPEVVESWRRFLNATNRLGALLRTHAQTVDISELTHDPAWARQKQKTESPLPESPGSALPPPNQASPRKAIPGLHALLSLRVPFRIIPVALLTPVAAIFLLWLIKLSFPAATPAQCAFSVLAPTVQVLDQGAWLPAGPINVNALVRLQNPSAAVRLEWSASNCQAIISGKGNLLITESSLGLMHQEGECTYEVIAREVPLRLWTAAGIVEVQEARFILDGGSSILRYRILEGGVRLGGKAISAPEAGLWGAAAAIAAPVNPGDGNPAGQSNTEKTGAETALANPSAAGARRLAQGLDADGASTPALTLSPSAESLRRHHLYGQVLRTNLAPVEGVKVILRYWKECEEGLESQDHATTVTGPDGWFKFRGLEDVKTGLLGVEHISLVAEQAWREVEMDQDNLQVLLYETCSISGKVIPVQKTEPVGEFGIEVLEVRERWGHASAAPLAPPDARRVRVSIEEESFEITGLPPGLFRLRAASRQGQTGETGDIKLDVEESRTDVEIPLRPGGMLVGRVVSSATLQGVGLAHVELRSQADRGRGDDRAPGPGAGLPGERRPGEGRLGEGRPPNPPPPDSEQAPRRSKVSIIEADCDANGDFSIPGLAPGAYEVRASAESYVETRKSVRIKAGETREEVIELFSTPGVVFGRVLDGEGEAIANVQVQADQLPEKLYEQVRTATDSDGRYELNLAPGRWNLRAQAQGDSASWARDSIEIVLPERYERNFVLFPGVKVTGLVTRGGVPAAQMRIEFVPAGASRRGTGRTQTGKDGRYEIQLRQGEYNAILGGQRRATLSLHGLAHCERDFEIPDTLLNGVVSSAETGEPIAQASVVLEQTSAGASDPLAARQAIRPTRTNTNGFYEFRGLEPGEYRIRAAAAGYTDAADSIKTIAIGAQAVYTVPIALTPATATLEILAVDGASQKPLSGVAPARVLWGEGAAPLLVTCQPRLTGDDGRMKILNLPPGTYSFTFSRTSGGSLYQPVIIAGIAIEAGQPNALTAAMTQGGRLRILVQKPPDGSTAGDSFFLPVPGAAVRLIAPPQAANQGLALEKRTDLEGRAAFEPLAQGYYSVEVSVPNSPGLAPAMQGGTVNPGQTLELTVRLRPSAR